MGSRRNIYMNPPLDALAEKINETGKGRDGKFSRRLGDIVERYAVLQELVPAPEMTDVEIEILGAVICGSPVTKTQVRLLPEYIMDSGAFSPDDRKIFADKVNSWSFAERLMAIEAIYPV